MLVNLGPQKQRRSTGLGTSVERTTAVVLLLHKALQYIKPGPPGKQASKQASTERSSVRPGARQSLPGGNYSNIQAVYLKRCRAIHTGPVSIAERREAVTLSTCLSCLSASDWELHWSTWRRPSMANGSPRRWRISMSTWRHWVGVWVGWRRFFCLFIMFLYIIYIHIYIHNIHYMYVCMYVYIHTFIHMQMHSYIHTHIHTYIHTYIHTVKPP